MLMNQHDSIVKKQILEKRNPLVGLFKGFWFYGQRQEIKKHKTYITSSTKHIHIYIYIFCNGTLYVYAYRYMLNCALDKICFI